MKREVQIKITGTTFHQSVWQKLENLTTCSFSETGCNGLAGDSRKGTSAA